MSTTVKSTGTVTATRGFGGGSGPPGSNGNGWHPKKDGDERRRFRPGFYRITMWVALGAIVMMFAALSSVYVALPREGWRPIRMPRLFFLSSAIILSSSATMESARRALKHGIARCRRLLTYTLLLGVAFLALQLLGWQQLIEQKVYLAGQPHSSFFYLFTGVHGVHVIAGLLGLSYLIVRARRPLLAPEVEVALIDSASLYWHFMGGIWLWLFLLLLIWR